MALVAPYVDGKLQTSTTSSESLTNSSNSGSTINSDTFLTILVAEMQNQDPLEPTSNTEWVSQYATFTQVEATKEMLDTVSRQTASSLVGKTVIMTTDLNKDGYVAGKVDYWEVISGTIYLGIDGKLYDIADLDTVMDEEYYKKWDNIENGTTDETE